PFSPCGRWLVRGGKVYDVATGTDLFTPTAEPGETLYWCFRYQWQEMHKTRIWFSDDSRLIAGWLMREAGGRRELTGTLAVWELASGNILARFPGAGFVGQVAFSPDSRLIAL